MALHACVAALLGLTLAAPLAQADGVADEAELHFQIATDAYRANDFRTALEHFLTSNRLVPNANVVFNIARTYEALGRFPDAYRYYVDAQLATTLSARLRPDVDAALHRIAPNVAVLHVESDPPGATIFIDRRELGSRGRAPRSLGFPGGTYRVLADLEGYEPTQSEPVEVRAGSDVTIHLSLRRIVGTVQVEGEPGAAVHIDDDRAPVRCVSPCAVQLSPGTHTLFLTATAHETQTLPVTIVAQQTISVRASLRALTGSVLVNADETGALVEVDGHAAGFTPVVLNNIPVGQRRIRVSLRGYNAIESVVEVHANQQSELGGIRLVPEREVTAASRVAETIEDAPSSVSVVQYQELRAFGFPTIAEALRGVRGISLNNDRSYFSATIRGIGQPNDYGNRVLVLSDGASLNDNLLNSSYIGSDGRADLHDVDRIEVVRGPGSLLYGTGAFSGVINLVTRRRDEPTSANAAIGTYDNAVATGRAGFTLNLGPNRGLWVSVSGARSDGVDVPVTFYNPAPGEPATQTANRVDAFSSQGIAARAWWGPLTAQFFTHSREQHIPVGAFATLFNDSRTAFIDTRYLAELRFEPRIGDHVQIFTRAHFDRYTFRGIYAYDPLPNLEDYAGTWFGVEARVIWTPLQGMRITVGGEYQDHLEATMTGCCKSTEDPTVASGTPYLNERQPYSFGAVYGLFEHRFTDWFRLSAGVRADIYTTFGAIFVPRAALIFRPVTGGVLKIMGGRSFRAPSIYESYYSDGGVTQMPAVQPGRGLSLGPESIWSGEIEYSQRFLENWVGLVSLWGGYSEGIVQSVPDMPESPLIRYANSTQPVINAGADIEVRREFHQGWMVTAMVGYQRAQYLSAPTFAQGWFPNAPEILASVRAIVPIVPTLAVGALRISAESGRRIADNTGDMTPPFVAADAILSGTVQRFGVHYNVGVYNLFDWRYEYPVTQSFISRTMVQNGRTFRLDLSVQF